MAPSQHADTAAGGVRAHPPGSHPTRRQFLGGAAAVAATTAAWPAATRAQQPRPKPNIVLIYADDLDFDEVPCYDATRFPCDYGDQVRKGGIPNEDAGTGPGLIMPNVARLAREGTRFDRFYITSSVCTPSRYSLLTGRYASRCPAFLQRNPPGQPATIRWNTPLSPTEINIAKVLNARGYATGMVGKWHNFLGNIGEGRLKRLPEDGDPRDPDIAGTLRALHEKARASIRACGFDSADRIHIGNTEHINPKAIRGHNPEWVTEGAIAFIEEHRRHPFFLYMPLTLPHGAYNVRWMKQSNPLATTAGMLETPPESGMSPRDAILERVRAAGIDENLAMGTWLDEVVGAVLRKLEQTKLIDHTLVLFISDHQSRGKYTCYEGARTPALAFWPGRVPAGARIDRVCANIDVLPTLIELTGGTIPAQATDGISFVPLLLGNTDHDDARDAILLEVGNTRAAVTGRWKYLASRVSDEVQAKMDDDAAEAKRLGRRRMVGWDGARNWHPWQQTSGGIVYNSDVRYPNYFDTDQLYDLVNDPFEQKNLATDPAHADTLAHMRSVLTELLAPLPHTFGEFRTA